MKRLEIAMKKKRKSLFNKHIKQTILFVHNTFFFLIFKLKTKLIFFKKK
jgi:hypothetical protein